MIINSHYINNLSTNLIIISRWTPPQPGTEYRNLTSRRDLQVNMISPVLIKQESPTVSRWSSLSSSPISAPCPTMADKHWCNWNTESRGNSSYSERERALVHPWQSHGAVLSLHTGPRCLWCMALFPFLSHQSNIIDSEGRVMFYKVKHINGFHCTLRCLDVLGSVSGGLK